MQLQVDQPLAAAPHGFVIPMQRDMTKPAELVRIMLAHDLREHGIDLASRPELAAIPSDTDAVVVALKSRTIAASDAVARSLEALRWLRAQGCGQFYFKVCSTFDSTPRGNIGPVAEALLEALGADFCCVTPAFPENARTVFQGHLFVGDVLLSDSGMRNHPLTPMTDANLVRVMQAQTRRRVGLVAHDVVARGEEAIRDRFAALQAQGVVQPEGGGNIQAVGEHQPFGVRVDLQTRVVRQRLLPPQHRVA